MNDTFRDGIKTGNRKEEGFKVQAQFHQKFI